MARHHAVVREAALVEDDVGGEHELKVVALRRAEVVVEVDPDGPTGKRRPNPPVQVGRPCDGVAAVLRVARGAIVLRDPPPGRSVVAAPPERVVEGEVVDRQPLVTAPQRRCGFLLPLVVAHCHVGDVERDLVRLAVLERRCGSVALVLDPLRMVAAPPRKGVLHVVAVERHVRRAVDRAGPVGLTGAPQHVDVAECGGVRRRVVEDLADVDAVGRRTDAGRQRARPRGRARDDARAARVACGLPLDEHAPASIATATTTVRPTAVTRPRRLTPRRTCRADASIRACPRRPTTRRGVRRRRDRRWSPAWRSAVPPARCRGTHAR